VASICRQINNRRTNNLRALGAVAYTTKPLDVRAVLPMLDERLSREQGPGRLDGGGIA
jgi:hypothetical protein